MRSIVVAVAFAIAMSSSVRAEPQLARVALADLPKATAIGLQIVETYPGFALVEASAETLARASTQGLELQAESFGYRLTLPYGASADPQSQHPWSRQAAQSLPRGLVLVQFHGPTQPQWIAALESAGVGVVQYFHPYTYLLWNGDGGLDTVVRDLPAVRWAGEWPLSARLPSELQSRSAAAQTVRVISYRPASPARSQFEQLNAEVIGASAAIDQIMTETQVRIAGSALAELAAAPGVISIQSVPQDGGLRGEVSNQQFAGNVGGNNLPTLNYLGWLAGFAVNGQGVRIANVDAGVDQTHPNLVNRMVSCTGTTCGNAATDSHGTHTAGIMVADGSDDIRNTGGFLRGLGVAPGATLVEQKYAPFYLQAGGMLLLMRDSAANGALLSGNSWGPAGSPRGYDADTRQVDVGVRDTDPDTAGDQPLTYVLSIMNGNGGTSSQGTPDEAKNAITVGSTNSQTNANAVNTNWQSISSNSGHGPALDGRKIPHMVAPGCSVDSTVPGTYGMKCGTSMASPHVTGAVALFAEGYRRLTRAWPSAALTRAALIAATVDLSGFTDANGGVLGHRPDSKQGWGALRLGNLLSQLQNAVFVDQFQVFTATGNSWQMEFSPKNSQLPITVSLSYTDAPGHGLCASGTCTTPAWNNDLNLTVSAGSSSYKGNVFDSQGRSQVGGIADERNNLEGVVFEAGRISGSFTVTVSAANISSDALPNVAGSLAQDFALVCNNCQLISDTIFLNGFEDGALEK